MKSIIVGPLEMNSRSMVARALTLILASGAIWHASAREPTAMNQSPQGFESPREASQQIRLAHARQLAAQAGQAGNSDLDLSLLLSLEALGLLSPEDYLMVPSAIEALREALALAGSGSLAGEAVEPRVLTGHRDSIRALAYLPDRGLLASAGDDRVIRLWSLDDPTAEVRVLEGHEDTISSLVYLPDRGQLASGGRDTTVRLWSLDRPGEKPRVLRGHDAVVVSVVYLPDRGVLASADYPGAIRLWPLDTASEKVRILYHGYGIGQLDLLYLADRELLVSGFADRTLKVWSPEKSTRPVEVLRRHGGSVWSLTYLPDRALLASGGETRLNPHGMAPPSAMGDGAIRLWDLKQGYQQSRVLRGHRDFVSSLAYLPDRVLLASGSVDGTLRLWPLDGADHEHQILEHGDSVFTVIYLADRGLLASAGIDATIRLWRLDHQELRELACGLVERNLSWSEWQRAFGDVPYRQTCPQQPAHPSIIEYALAVGDELAKQQDLAGATRQYQRALDLGYGRELQPNARAVEQAVEHLIWLGDDQASLGRLGDAEKFYRRALDLYPDRDGEPGKRARSIATESLAMAYKSIGIDLATDGDLNRAIANFEQALQIEPRLINDPEEQTRIWFTMGAMASAGRFRERLESAQANGISFTEVRDLLLTLPISKQSNAAALWEALCRSGSLSAHAKEVLEDCRQAVILAPDQIRHRDSLALALALSGDLEGAIENLQHLVDRGTGADMSEEKIRRREAWIRALKGGKNPFTAEVLESFR